MGDGERVLFTTVTSGVAVGDACATNDIQNFKRAAAGGLEGSRS